MGHTYDLDIISIFNHLLNRPMYAKRACLLFHDGCSKPSHNYCCDDFCAAGETCVPVCPVVIDEITNSK